VNPYGGTNSLDTISAFIKALSYLLAGEGVWGRGRRHPSTEMLSTFDPMRPLGPRLVFQGEDRIRFRSKYAHRRIANRRACNMASKPARGSLQSRTATRCEKIESAVTAWMTAE
jgi:hypothetical protein